MKKLIVFLLLVSNSVFASNVSFPMHNLLSTEDKAYLNGSQIFQAPAFPKLSNHTYLATVADFGSKKRKSEKPPVDGGRIAGEIAAAFGLGLAFWFAGYIAGGVDTDQGAATGVYCYPFGSALGVWLVGNIGNEAGSYLAALAGTGLGFISVFVISRFVIQFKSHEAAFTSFLLGPPIGATVLFNLTRRYDSPSDSKTGLINFRDGRLSFAVPSIYLRPDRFDGFLVKPFDKRTFIQNIDLVKLDF